MIENNKTIIPLYQIIFIAIFIFLIVGRIIINNDNLVKYVNIVNYISMIVSFTGVWFTTMYKTKKSREKNICKSVFIIIIIIFVLYGCCLFFLDNITPTKLNDIFTLTALMFCICNIIFEKIIIKIFGLEYI